MPINVLKYPSHILNSVGNEGMPMGVSDLLHQIGLEFLGVSTFPLGFDRQKHPLETDEEI